MSCSMSEPELTEQELANVERRKAAKQKRAAAFKADAKVRRLVSVAACAHAYAVPVSWRRQWREGAKGKAESHEVGRYCRDCGGLSILGGPYTDAAAFARLVKKADACDHTSGQPSPKRTAVYRRERVREDYYAMRPWGSACSRCGQHTTLEPSR